MVDHNVRKESALLAAGFVVLSIALKIAFSNSSIPEVLRVAFAVYWIFVIPGYALSLCSSRHFVERLIIGIGVQAAVFGLLSYYLGLLGWHVSSHGLVLPLFSIIAGVLLWLRGKK